MPAKTATKTETTARLARSRQSRPTTKSEIVAKALRRHQGASLSQLMQTTGWQAHSVRGHLSRLRRAGLPLERFTDKAGKPRYRLPKGAPAT